MGHDEEWHDTAHLYCMTSELLPHPKRYQTSDPRLIATRGTTPIRPPFGHLWLRIGGRGCAQCRTSIAAEINSRANVPYGQASRAFAGAPALASSTPAGRSGVPGRYASRATCSIPAQVYQRKGDGLHSFWVGNSQFRRADSSLTTSGSAMAST